MDYNYDYLYGYYDYGIYGGVLVQVDFGKVIDLVCGMQVMIKFEVWYCDYEGQIFYFCLDGCQLKFDGDLWFYVLGVVVKVEKFVLVGM